MFKQAIAAAALLGAGLAQAFMPQSGTWVVTSEVNGLPGRGLAMDAQNGTLVMQMYAYESNGQSSFYLASGPLSNDRFTGPLTRYSGGRYFGSGPRSGVEAGTPGNVSIRFTSGTTGFITFPGEPEVAISRFNFGYPATVQSLKGLWTFTSLGSEGVLADAAVLSVQTAGTSGGNGIMQTSDNRFGCEHQTSGSLAGGVLCVKVDASGTQLLRSYYFLYSVNEGEGFSSAYGTGPSQSLSVQRLTTPQGVGTGIYYKSAAEDAAPSTALHDHISRLAAEGLGR